VQAQHSQLLKFQDHKNLVSSRANSSLIGPLVYLAPLPMFITLRARMRKAWSRSVPNERNLSSVRLPTPLANHIVSTSVDALAADRWQGRLASLIPTLPVIESLRPQ
jgi:hypothetical protein